MDSDDYLHPQTIATCVELLERYDADLVEYGFRRTTALQPDFPPIGTPEEPILLEDPARIELRADHICCNKLFRSEIVKRLGLAFRYRIWEDTLFTRQYALACRRAVFIASPFYCYYVNPASLSSCLSPEKLYQSIIRADEVIDVYRKAGLQARAEEYKEQSRRFLMRHLFDLASGPSARLQIPRESELARYCSKELETFNTRRRRYRLLCYRTFGLRFTIKRLLRRWL